VPFYAIARPDSIEARRARRLGLVTLSQMVDALVTAVENPPPAGQFGLSKFLQYGRVSIVQP
jgi:hypothetical protein